MPTFRPATLAQSVFPEVLTARLPSPPSKVLPVSGGTHDGLKGALVLTGSKSHPLGSSACPGTRYSALRVATSVAIANPLVLRRLLVPTSRIRAGGGGSAETDFVIAEDAVGKA